MIEGLDGPNARLFCFPHAGGSGLAFRTWSNFGHGIELVPLDYPGHLMRSDERLARSMEDLVSQLFPELFDRCDLPFAFFGSSLGALVAFELTRAFEAAGRPPEIIVLAACPAPNKLRKHPPISELGDEDFLQVFCERYGGLVREIADDPEVRAMVLPMIRADMELFEAYSTSSPDPISRDIIAVAGDADSVATPSDAAAWVSFSTGTVEFLSVAGDHFFVESQSDCLIKAIGASLSARLNEEHDLRTN